MNKENIDNIKIIKLFFRFLKENNAYQIFMENYNNNNIVFCEYRDFRFNWNSLFNVKNTPIDCFDWDEAIMGFEYWDELNDKWIKCLKNNNIKILM